MSKIKNINVNKLQANISKIIQESKKGTIFHIIRYSKSEAVLMSYKKYQDLEKEICHKCAVEIRKTLKELKNK